MPRLNRVQLEDFSGALQTRTNDALMLDRQVKHVLNGEFSSALGSIIGRMGSIVQSTVVSAKQTLNMAQWLKNDGTMKYFAVADDGQATPKVDVYVNSNNDFSGTWSKSLQDWTTSLNINFTNFANKLFAFNGVDAPVAFDGSTWTAVTNAPATGIYPEVYNQRLYVLSANGTLYYSDVINSSGTDFTTTAWTDRGINPNDGQKGRMLIRHRGRLIIYKDESIYRYNGTNEPEAVITVGTHSSNSVVLLNELYHHHPTGIWRMGVGEPVLISRSVKKYLDGMDSSNWTNVAGGRDLENVYMWIGNVTIKDPFAFDYGRSYTDVVLVYNVYSNNWTVFSNWNARKWYYDSVAGTTYFATSTGKIVKINTGYSDIDGATANKIQFEVIFQPINAHFLEKDKEFDQVFIIGKYSSDILIGKDYEDMKVRSAIENEIGTANQGITCKELWVGVSEEYSDIPPRIDALIVDKINLLSDTL